MSGRLIVPDFLLCQSTRASVILESWEEEEEEEEEEMMINLHLVINASFIIIKVKFLSKAQLQISWSKVAIDKNSRNS
jgi:hypothetical protein